MNMNVSIAHPASKEFAKYDVGKMSEDEETFMIYSQMCGNDSDLRYGRRKGEEGKGMSLANYFRYEG